LSGRAEELAFRAAEPNCRYVIAGWAVYSSGLKGWSYPSSTVREEAPSGVCSAFTCAPPCYGFKVVLPCARSGPSSHFDASFSSSNGLNFEWQKRIGLGYLILLRFRVASPVESLRLFSVFFLCNLPFFVGCGVSVWPRLWRFSSMIPLDCKDGWLLRYAISSLLVLGSALKASEESELEAIIKE
ncbi:hypothetical protein IGI04_040453, partial [Brassica rapa subsp. trilocularis]